MENEVENKKDKDKVIKRQRIAIIILSVYVVLCISSLVYKAVLNQAEIKFVSTYYTPPNSFYDGYELEILCKQDKIFNVNDFTFFKNGDNICVNKIDVDGKTYENEQSFVIKEYEKTKIVLYIALYTEEVKTIYYKSKPIEYGHTRKV